MDASSAPARRAETAGMTASYQGGTLDASSVPAGRVESDPGAAAASDTDQGNGEDSPVLLSGRAAHEFSTWGRLPATVRGRTRGQSQHLEGEPAEEQYRLNPEVADALLAARNELKSGNMQKSTSWTTEDAMAMMAGAPPAEENKGELSVCMPNGFPEDVEPPPQSVVDIERSQYKTAWRRTDLVHWLCFQAQ